MKVFIGEIPEIKNPCDNCKLLSDGHVFVDNYGCTFNLNCTKLHKYLIEQSILSQLKEIDIDKLFGQYWLEGEFYIEDTKFSDFIEQQINEARKDNKWNLKLPVL
jgi:hypothetical protein